MSLEEDQAIKILQTALLTHLLYTPCDIVCHNTTGYIPPLVTSDLEHGCLWLPQLVKGGLARGHLYDGAAQRPDVRRLAVASRPLVYDLGSHVLQSACKIRTCLNYWDTRKKNK